MHSFQVVLVVMCATTQRENANTLGMQLKSLRYISLVPRTFFVCVCVSLFFKHLRRIFKLDRDTRLFRTKLDVHTPEHYCMQPCAVLTTSHRATGRFHRITLLNPSSE